MINKENTEMKHITKDNQIIEVGTRIIYDGDRANAPGRFEVTGITESQSYKLNIWVKEIGGEGREKRLFPMYLEPGLGCRYITEEKRKADRDVKLEALYSSMEANRKAKL
jgi:hypothetical protein